MQADFVLDYDSITVDQPHKVHLMARFAAGPAPDDDSRRSLNLSLVIDRSGSMAGKKIDYTRQAAQFLVQNLSLRDTLSIVLYNQQVEILLPPEKIQRKDVINQRIGAIKSGGTTNLSSGWLEGCKLVGENLDADALNRVILMSDGLANRGVTDTDKLVQMARQKLGANISTTTMGLGDDFNEDLMMAMASAGGGAFYFIESPEVTPMIFQEELRGLLRVIGQNLTVSIQPSRHVRLVNQLNAYPMHSDGRELSFRMGDIFGEEVKALLMELSLHPMTEPGRQQIALVRFEYDELRNGGSRHQVIEMPVLVDVRGVESGAIVEVNPEVSQSILLLQAAQARREAVSAADQGEFDTAAMTLRNAAKAIEKSEGHNDQLDDERAALLQQADEIEQHYDPRSRKMMSTQAFYTMNSRHEDTMMLRNRAAEASQPSTDEGADLEAEPRSGQAPTHILWRDQTFALTGDLIRIGRSRHNEITLDVNGISRFHCQIKRQGDQFILEDLGSTNGTSVNGVRLDKPYPLRAGDQVNVCEEVLLFEDKANE